jgi:DNA topoisomerase-3
MKLVIAEKPSVARAIAGVLGANEKKEGYLIGNGYMVSWCIGHLVSLATPEEYDQKYLSWQYKDLPISPSKWRFSVNKKTEKQYRILEKLIKQEQVTSLVEATDSGREGELIFRLLYDNVGVQKPFERLWISSMEDSAIKLGFDQLKSGTDYENLYQSAISRAKADWIVGLNATRLFTTTYNSKLTVGRVQTPTLAMIADRDEKIKHFQKQKYYYVHLDLGDFIVKSSRLDLLDDAEQLIRFCSGKNAVVKDVIKDLKKKKPPKLYDLTTLQREANRYYGYTAQQTLEYAQSLYEKKLITYPRTDSCFITVDMEDSARALIDGFGGLESPNITRIINDEKVSDHHAIIPTKSSMNLKKDQIPSSEATIFNLIKMKLIAAVGLDFIYEEILVNVDVEGKEFSAKEIVLIELGFKKVEDDLKKFLGQKLDETGKESMALKKLKENDAFSIQSVEQLEGWTSPPKYFTEDTLLSAMERAGVEELDEALDVEKKGLGTPATRASIIEKLIHIGYVERKIKNLMVTDKGTELIKIVPDRIKSTQLTAQWENRLTEIANGNDSADQFIQEIQNEISELVASYIDFKDSTLFRSTKESIGNCPRCLSEVYEGNKNFYCSNKVCEFSMWKEDKFFTGKKKKLSKAMAIALLTKGKIKVKNLYSEKKDTNYDATVILKDTGTWVNYQLEFDKKYKRK